MNFEQIKAESSSLTPEQRRQLIGHLLALGRKDDPDFRRKLAAKIDDNNPSRWIAGRISTARSGSPIHGEPCSATAAQRAGRGTSRASVMPIKITFCDPRATISSLVMTAKLRIQLSPSHPRSTSQSFVNLPSE